MSLLKLYPDKAGDARNPVDKKRRMNFRSLQAIIRIYVYSSGKSRKNLNCFIWKQWKFFGIYCLSVYEHQSLEPTSTAFTICLGKKNARRKRLDILLRKFFCGRINSGISLKKTVFEQPTIKWVSLEPSEWNANFTANLNHSFTLTVSRRIEKAPFHRHVFPLIRYSLCLWVEK